MMNIRNKNMMKMKLKTELKLLRSFDFINLARWLKIVLFGDDDDGDHSKKFVLKFKTIITIRDFGEI